MFNLIEESLFSSRYFMTLNKSFNTIELQSRKYGGCWIIQKGSYPNCGVNIHHKSSFYGKYYYFDTVNSVTDAIHKIRKHEVDINYSFY